MRMIVSILLLIVGLTVSGCKNQQDQKIETTNTINSTATTTVLKDCKTQDCSKDEYDKWIRKEWKAACKTDMLNEPDQRDKPL